MTFLPEFHADLSRYEEMRVPINYRIHYHVSDSHTNLVICNVM